MAVVGTFQANPVRAVVVTVRWLEATSGGHLLGPGQDTSNQNKCQQRLQEDLNVMVPTEDHQPCVLPGASNAGPLHLPGTLGPRLGVCILTQREAALLGPKSKAPAGRRRPSGIRLGILLA